MSSPGRPVGSDTDCGICEMQTDQFDPAVKIVCWYNHRSRFAHTECFSAIAAAAATFYKAIDTTYSVTCDRNYAQTRGVIEIKKQLGDTSIMSYLKTNGPDKLKALFDSAAREIE